MNRFQSWYSRQPVALRTLLTINVAFYVAWVVLLRFIGPVAGFVVNHLALHPGLPGLLFEPWQLITYNFLHLGVGLGGILHILFNMLWLVWIGREYEEMQGAHRHLAIYLLTGVGGGLLTVLYYALFPEGGVPYVYGASASVMGVLAAVATFYPNKSIGLFLLGVVPLKWIVIGLLVLDVFVFAGSGTAVTAHLGGALFGFLFAKGEQRGMDLSSWARFFFRKRGARGGRKTSARAGRRSPAAREEGGVLGRLERWLASRNASKERDEPRSEAKPSKRARITRLRPARGEDEPTGKDQALEVEVDRLLEKISEQGYDSLTEEEKRFLYEASKR